MRLQRRQRKPGTAVKVIKQLQKIGMDFTAVHEISWTGTGTQIIGKLVVFLH